MTKRELIFDQHEVSNVHHALRRTNPHYHTADETALMDRIEQCWRQSERPVGSYIETNGWCAMFWGDDFGHVHCKVTPSAYGVAKYVNAL